MGWAFWFLILLIGRAVLKFPKGPWWKGWGFGFGGLNWFQRGFPKGRPGSFFQIGGPGAFGVPGKAN